VTYDLEIILQITSRCVYELKTHRYNSAKHNHVFQSEMTIYFGLKKTITRPPLKKTLKQGVTQYKLRCDTVQIKV